jgi:hypothetical protein
MRSDDKQNAGKRLFEFACVRISSLLYPCQSDAVDTPMPTRMPTRMPQMGTTGGGEVSTWGVYECGRDFFLMGKVDVPLALLSVLVSSKDAEIERTPVNPPSSPALECKRKT